MLKTISVWALLAATAVIQPTMTQPPQEQPKVSTTQQVEEFAAKYAQPPITAPVTAKINFERVALKTAPAPKPEPKPEPKKEASETTTTEEVGTVASESTTNTATAKTQIATTPQATAAPQTAQSEGANTAPAPTASPANPTIITTPGSAQAEAARQMQAYGWGADQLTCLVSLWEKESNWNFKAENPSSGAYGIPQSLPGNKMASAGADWRTNPATQIKWGLGYIKERYKTPCGAWGHSVAVGWY